MDDRSAIVYNKCKKALDSKFGKNKIAVSSRRNYAPSNFPAAGIRQIGMPSISPTMNDRQAYQISTIQVDTYSITTEQEALKVMEVIADTLNSLGYGMDYGVEDISQNNNLIRLVARFSRMIGTGDIL